MELTEAVHVLAALAQYTRLELMRLLLAAGPNGLPAGNIAARIAVAPSTLSFHLATLERAGLTQSTRRGRQIVHAARIEGLRRLLVFLMETRVFLTETRGAGLSALTGLLAPFPEESSFMSPAFNVLFLCTQNAARSIMAEAILHKFGGTRFQAYSAGSDPAPAPRAEVLEKLAALGHDVSELHSKSWLVFTGANAPRMDFVVTLCEIVDGQACPDFGALPVTGAWPLPDPAKFTGPPAEQSALLNELYASLRRRIEIFVALPFAALDRMAMKARLDEIGDGMVLAGRY